MKSHYPPPKSSSGEPEEVHLPETVLRQYHDGILSDKDEDEIEMHLDRCERCTAKIRDMGGHGD